MGRPTKFIAFFEAMREVLKDPNTVILTDKELHVLVNMKLKPAQRCSFETFSRWKMPKINIKSPEMQDGVTAEMAAEFRQVLQGARVMQKMALTNSMLDHKNKNQWGSSWILERKFDDLKLKQNLALGEGNVAIQINVGKPEHKQLIEGLLDGDTIDIDHEQV